MAISSTRGYQIHRNRLRRMMNIKDDAVRALADAGEAVREDAQKSIRAGAVSGPGHVPSRPGEPPNADTHNLDLSIDVVINPGRLSVSVIARAPYSAALEFGTSRMLARPFLRPSMHRNRNRLLYGLANSISSGAVRVYKGEGAFSAAGARYANGG